MKQLQRIEVPVVEDGDINRSLSTWHDGRYVALDEGAYVTLYVDHREERRVDVVTEYGTDAENYVEVPVMTACPIRVSKPVSRDMAINAAEMAAYGLRNAMEVASFNASLARKSRIDPNDSEVVEHDEFIGWIKEKLTEIGV